MADWRDEEERFDVVLIEAGPRKISVIKVLREMLGLSLSEGKDFIEGAPRTVKADVAREEAYSLRERLEQVEALVQLRSRPGTSGDR
jgi:large subunit ribosomal protein L7/L12